MVICINMQKIRLFHWFVLDIGWLKNPGIWLAENILAHIQKQEFSQIWDLCSSTANNINFHYRPTSVKINDQIFHQVQKTLFLTLFGSIFPIFEAKKIFPEIPALSHTTSYGFLAPCQNLEKIDYTIPRKCPDRRKDGWKDGRRDRPYFIGPFWLPTGVQFSKR